MHPTYFSHGVESSLFIVSICWGLCDHLTPEPFSFAYLRERSRSGVENALRLIDAKANREQRYCCWETMNDTNRDIKITKYVKRNQSSNRKSLKTGFRLERDTCIRTCSHVFCFSLSSNHPSVYNTLISKDWSWFDWVLKLFVDTTQKFTKMRKRCVTYNLRDSYVTGSEVGH